MGPNDVISRPKGLFGRAGPLMAARLAAAVLTFGVPLVLARLLVPADYGTFKQAWLVASTLTLVLPFGLSQSLYYFLPREPEQRATFVTQTWVTTSAIGIAGAALLSLFGPAVARAFDNPALEGVIPPLAVYTGFTLAGCALDTAYAGMGRLWSAAFARLGTEGLRAGAMVAGTWLTGTAQGVLWGMALAAVARAVAGVWLLARAAGLRWDGAVLRRQLAYALPFGLAAALFVPQQQLHQYAVGASVSPAQFAIYAVGCLQLPLIDLLYTPVSEVLQLGLAERRHPRDGLPLFREAVSQLASAFLPLYGVLFVCAPALITFLFTETYAGAAPIFRLFMLTAPIAALPLDAVLRAHAQSGYMLGMGALRLAASIPAVAAGLALGGPAGALTGWLVVEGMARVLMLQRAARLFQAGLRELLPWGALLRQVLAALGAAALASHGLRIAPGPMVLRLALCGLVYAAVYLVVLAVLSRLAARAPSARLLPKIG
jgi:O-antigen/teichoic acid export membrane protein